MAILRNTLIVLACCAGALRAQGNAWDTRREYTTRPQLEALISRLDSAGRAGGGDRAAAARRDAAAVRKRLDDGDFQSGDRILLRVEGEQQLSDTFTVDEGRAVQLPTVGEVSLAGVLRSEIESFMQHRIAVFIKNPIVHARPLIRIGVVGEVNHPGFYLVPPTSQVEDALMAAGGPTRDSKLGGVVVQRVDGQVWGSDFMQRAIGEGRTLDQLGVRSGDRLVVPRHGDFGRTITLLSALVAIPVSIFALTRVVH